MRYYVEMPDHLIVTEEIIETKERLKNTVLANKENILNHRQHDRVEMFYEYIRNTSFVSIRYDVELFVMYSDTITPDYIIAL